MDMNTFSLTKHDPELVALIKECDHKVLAVWAMDCFNRNRYLFKKEYPENEIIDTALDTLQMWIENRKTMWEARKYCWVILKAAREIEAKDKVACQMLRACSHTLATCHVPTHAEGSCSYVISAMQYFYAQQKDVIDRMSEERQWQIDHLSALMERNS